MTNNRIKGCSCAASAAKSKLVRNVTKVDCRFKPSTSNFSSALERIGVTDINLLKQVGLETLGISVNDAGSH
jgi:hypothetical protein